MQLFYRQYIDFCSIMEFTKINMATKLIETNPKILGGQPVIKGTRISVARVLALIGMGYTLKDIKEELPDLKELTKRDIAELLSYHQIRLTT